MPVEAFISYSHRDEKMLDRLHKHLAMLQREGTIRVWHDRQIDAGTEVDAAIRDSFQRSSLFLALVSPDFLASHYCYEREMLWALERHEGGDMVVVPIILEPCDWKSSPLGRLKALPKDGNAISLWSNENVALLDVVTELRHLLQGRPETPSIPKEEAARSEAGSAPRRLRVKRDFDTIDRAEFRDRSFGIIKNYFEQSVSEINKVGDPIRARFESMTATAFTCTIVNRAKQNGESYITVHNHKARGLGDITYTHVAHGEPNTANGMIMVDADEYQLHLRMDMFSGRAQGDRKLVAEEAAELLWSAFVARAGIDYA